MLGSVISRLVGVHLTTVDQLLRVFNMPVNLLAEGANLHWIDMLVLVGVANLHWIDALMLAVT